MNRCNSRLFTILSKNILKLFWAISHYNWFYSDIFLTNLPANRARPTSPSNMSSVIYCDNPNPSISMYARDLVDEPTFKMHVILDNWLSEEDRKFIQADLVVTAESNVMMHLMDVDGEAIADLVARGKTLGMKFRTPQDEQNFMNSSGDFFMTWSNDPIPVNVSFSPTPSS